MYSNSLGSPGLGGRGADSRVKCCTGQVARISNVGGVPSSPVADWHQKSPDISSTSALWTRWGQDGLSKFLQTAKNPRGGKAGPPMPTYTLKAEDADAVVAYLKSLP